MSHEYPYDDPASYIRVQTDYYKRCLLPTNYGQYRQVLRKWSRELVKQDLPKDFKKIEKYEGFHCQASHLDYQQVIGNCYNSYNPLDWIPKEGSCNSILNYMYHIFGEQYEFGLDYLTLIYKDPTQQLPILCLVSKERQTGKTTFLNLLRLIFGNNMTYNSSIDFRSRFNFDWVDKVIIGVEEVFLNTREDSEKFKNLATARMIKLEGKNKDKMEIPFFAKFVLCSNHEDDLIQIDPLESRYWVRKILPIAEQNTNLLEDMEKEIPFFLNFLLQRTMKIPSALSRMWFPEDQICTDALLKIKGIKRNSCETEILLRIKKILETMKITELHLTNNNLLNLLKNELQDLSTKQISIVLKKWKLVPVRNTLSYQTLGFNNSNELVPIRSRGRYYTFQLFWVIHKLDASRKTA